MVSEAAARFGRERARPATPSEEDGGYQWLPLAPLMIEH